MPLSDQRVVVLGGTSGIGLAVAAQAAQDGAEVVVASRNPHSVERALAALPAGTRGESADLADPTQVRELLGAIGEFDHLVFTAGEPLALLPADGLDLARAQEFFRLRYFGALAAVSAALPHLRPSGSVVLTSGTAGARPGPGWTVAAGICGAIEASVRALALELAPIRVNAVAPGVVRSPLWAPLTDADREQLYRSTAAATPLGRVGEPADIAQVYVSLMRQPFTTGTTATVDGGGVLV
ncbi:SDR family oxidoreductase [Kitasatospora sp. HPMI-4]|uniref:SDR family oxidoreductase n=1 Tax=Kitasatospora sp. HPMI-4 TaxID=3448443 RepID=UPI003F199805